MASDPAEPAAPDGTPISNPPPAKPPAYYFIDTPETLSSLLDTITALPTSPPSLYLDLEGISLSRHGSISILQLHVHPQDSTYLLDIHTLQHTAFTTPSRTSSSTHTLKSLLESPSIPKVFFDVRRDSDALHALFGISLAAVIDLQIMEFATRKKPGNFVSGLSRCIERDARLPRSRRRAWKECKEAGIKLFAPEQGGSYEVFNARPLRVEVGAYCVQDVSVMPKLWGVYERKMGGDEELREKVRRATEERVRASWESEFEGEGRHMAYGPWRNVEENTEEEMKGQMVNR